MKNKKMLALGTALVTLSGLVAATRAKGAAGTGNMSAVILAAISITNATTLSFGNITETGAGTISVDTAGGIGNTGGANPAGGIVSQGVLDITAGAAATSTRIRIDPTAGPSFTVKETVGAVATMNVKSFIFAWNGAGPGATITANMDTAQDINVGATLEVGAGQTTGTYTGSYVIEAAYQ